MSRIGGSLRTRRALLGQAGLGLLGLTLAPAASRAAAPFPGVLRLTVAGPNGGALARRAESLRARMASHFPAGSQLALDTAGGIDGVTGANQFMAQARLDGSMALLVPGAATLAFLAGDSRVHFDPSRWLPILARTEPGFLITRAGAKLGPPMRVAGATPLSPAIAGMLALDLLGIAITPVFGLDQQAALTALASNSVDAVLLQGVGQLETLPQTHPGLAPLFSLGTETGTGLGRDPMVPSLPTLQEYAAQIGRTLPGGARYAAWRSTAGAAQIRYALVLPALTPPSSVALWRNAGADAEAPDLAGSVHVVLAATAAALLESLSPGAAALLQFRTWVTSRLGWQPG